MSYEQISALLEKYWEGETSLEDERALKAYFAAPAVDERLRKFQPLFAALRAERSVQMAEHQNAAPMRASLGGRVFRYAAAASVAGLLAFGAWWVAQPVEQQAVATSAMFRDTYDDPQKAAAEVKAALALVGSKMRKGEQIAAKGLQKTMPLGKFFARPKHRAIAKASLQDTYDNPEQAAAEIRAALALVSSKIRKGRSEAAKGLQKMESVDKFIIQPESSKN